MKKFNILRCDCGEGATYLLEYNSNLMLLCQECLNEWIRMFGEGSLNFIVLSDLEVALKWAIEQNNISVKIYEKRIRDLMNQIGSITKKLIKEID